jgi:hypothetical protein
MRGDNQKAGEFIGFCARCRLRLIDVCWYNSGSRFGMVGSADQNRAPDLFPIFGRMLQKTFVMSRTFTRF